MSAAGALRSGPGAPGGGARWLGGGALSLLVHGAVVALIALNVAPRPMPPQQLPKTRLDVSAYKVPQGEAAPEPSSGTRTRARAGSGPIMGGSAIPRAQAAPITPPQAPPVAATAPAGEVRTAIAPEGTARDASAPKAVVRRAAPPKAPAAKTMKAAGATVQAALAPARPVTAAAAPAQQPRVALAPQARVASAVQPAATPASSVAAQGQAVAAAPPTAPIAVALSAAPPPAEVRTPPQARVAARAPRQTATAAAAPQSPPQAALPPAAAPAPPEATTGEALAPATPAAPRATALPPPSTHTTAALAWTGGGARVDPASLAAIAAFMSPDEAAATGARLRDGIASLLASVPCSRLQTVFDPGTGTLQLRGHVPDPKLRAPLLAALRNRMGGSIPVADKTRILPPPQCSALAGIAAVGLPQSTDQETDPRIIGPGAYVRDYSYHAGQRLILDMQTPDYPSIVYVDYFDAGGNVIHLQPNARVPARQVPAKAQIVVGRPAPGHPALSVTIGPPYGQEIAAAFAASAPLYEGARPTIEPAAPYLAFLKGRVAALRARDPGFKGEWVYFFISTAAR